MDELAELLAVLIQMEKALLDERRAVLRIISFIKEKQEGGQHVTSTGNDIHRETGTLLPEQSVFGIAGYKG